MADQAPNDPNDYYSLLGITRSASQDMIKAAYRRTLLLLHPDKRKLDDPTPPANFGLLHDAFLTLSSATLRAAYDENIEQSRISPRPAQVVSLEEFDCSEGFGGAMTIWSLACRCGGKFKITEDDLEHGRHLVGCGGCSDVIWVGYEIVEENEPVDICIFVRAVRTLQQQTGIILGFIGSDLIYVKRHLIQDLVGCSAETIRRLG